MGAIRAKRPVSLAIQAIEECEVGVQPGTVGANIVLAHVEGVFEIIEVAHLQVAVDLVKLLHRHDRILDFRATDPLDADRELAGDDSLADHRQQWSSAAAQPRSAVSLDDDTHDVEADQAIGPDCLEGELSGFLRFQECRDVEEEWVRSEAGEYAQAIFRPALLVVNAEACSLTGGRHAPTFLHLCHASPILPWSLEVAGEDHLLVLAGEWEGRGSSYARNGDRPKPEAVDDCLREVRV